VKGITVEEDMDTPFYTPTGSCISLGDALRRLDISHRMVLGLASGRDFSPAGICLEESLINSQTRKFCTFAYADAFGVDMSALKSAYSIVVEGNESGEEFEQSQATMTSMIGELAQGSQGVDLGKFATARAACLMVHGPEEKACTLWQEKWGKVNPACFAQRR
jgi:hypothetical protein